VLSMFYVDDGLVAARTDVEADALVELVASIFEIRALGEPKDFLGIEISQDHAANTITITQKSKASALAAELGVSGCRGVLPMQSEVYAGLRAAHPGVPMADKQLYQRVLGSLLHLAQCTRPDIALPVSALAAYAAAPTKEHHVGTHEEVQRAGLSPCMGEQCPEVARSRLPLLLQQWKRSIKPVVRQPGKGCHCSRHSGSLLQCLETFHWWDLS
jgi:hypothetical protein